MSWQWSSLPPSDESRFVPHSSVVNASSVTEQHLTASKQAENADSKKVHSKKEAGVSETLSVSNTARHPIKEPPLGADNESGIEGATIICFTPEPSQGGTTGDVNVASSLDGRSTTDYELLDCVSSKGSIDVEEDKDCIGLEGPKETVSKNQKVTNEENRTQLSEDMAAILANLSPNSTLPSLSSGDEDSIPALPNLTVNIPQPETPPESDETKTPQAVPNGDLPQAYSEDTEKDKEPKEDDSTPDASPKVDDQHLPPFKNFLECKSTFTDTTKSEIGRILRKETPEGADLDAAPRGSADAMMCENTSEAAAAVSTQIECYTDVTKYKKALPGLNAINLRCAITAWIVTSSVLLIVCSHVFQQRVVMHSDIDVLTPEEDDFHCWACNDWKFQEKVRDLVKESDRIKEREESVEIRNVSLDAENYHLTEKAKEVEIRNSLLEEEIASLRTVLRNRSKLPTPRSDIHVGVPSTAFREYQSLKIHFHGFNSLDSTKGHVVKSPPFILFNHEWQVEMYPGGNVDVRDGMVSIYLRHLTESPVAISVQFALSDSGYKQFILADNHDGNLDNGIYGNGPQVAVYSSTMSVPRCQRTGSECSSGDLLQGRGDVGPESHPPNTLDSCTDGNSGTYLVDESVERITVKSGTGSDIQEGDTITIDADVFSEGGNDFADMYHTSNPSNPVWDYIGTYPCPGPGHQKITAHYTLAGGEPEQAVRVNFRYGGSRSHRSSCSTDGPYDDVDDLVFQVALARNVILSHTFAKETPLLGSDNLIHRSVLLKPENLNHGTLTIELRMKLDESNKSRVNFIPENPFGKHMLKLFLDAESADMLFELSNDDHSSKVQYHAHRLVLEANAPGLARLCEGSDKSTPVRIPDVEPQVFLQLLQYVYGGDISPDWENDAKKFIDAADKYEVIDLKVEAEAWHVTYSKFTVGNVIEELLYADTMNCPLLREAAMDFILKNAKEVIKPDSFENDLITKAITSEILMAMVAADQGNDSNDNDDESMSINDLRMALYEKGLDIDGSRELLISRLKK